MTVEVRLGVFVVRIGPVVPVVFIERQGRRDARVRVGGRGVLGLAELVGRIRCAEEFFAHVDPGSGARVRLAGDGAAQPDHQTVLRCEPSDHEQTHVSRGVGVDLTAGLQTRVGHAQVRVGHAEADVADLDDEAAVAGVHRGHPHL